MESNEVLKYADETDKAYGLAGMAISLVAWDAEDWLEYIDLDAAPDEAMHMTSEFYLMLAPRVGAKAVWEQSLKRFQITAAMTVANVTCREMVRHGHRSLPANTDAAIRNALADEGQALCDLEADEVSQIYGKSLAYCSRLFAHPTVCDLAVQLADILNKSRRMEANNLWQILDTLNHL